MRPRSGRIIVAPGRCCRGAGALKTDAGKRRAWNRWCCGYARRICDAGRSCPRAARQDRRADGSTQRASALGELRTRKGHLSLRSSCRTNVDTLKLIRRALDSRRPPFNPGPEWSTGTGFLQASAPAVFASPRRSRSARAGRAGGCADGREFGCRQGIANGGRGPASRPTANLAQENIDL